MLQNKNSFYAVAAVALSVIAWSCYSQAHEKDLEAKYVKAQAEAVAAKEASDAALRQEKQKEIESKQNEELKSLRSVFQEFMFDFRIENQSFSGGLGEWDEHWQQQKLTLQGYLRKVAAQVVTSAKALAK